MYRICIDFGHGSFDPGAIGQKGTLEKNINLQVGLKLTQKFIDNGFIIKLTRKSDNVTWNSKTDLQTRCDIANNFNADIFISIHCNSATNRSAYGAEVWTSVGETSSDVLAERIIEKYKTILPTQFVRVDMSDGDSDKEANYYVLRNTKMTAVLVELAFISNLEEEKLLNDNDFQNKCVDTIYSGVCEYLGIKELLGMFTDINNSYAKDSIEKLGKMGIFKGNGDGKFRPKDKITREEMAIVLDKILKLLGK